MISRMALRSFLLNCQRTFTDCIGLASSYHTEDDLNIIITRMQTMARSLVWSRVRLLDPETANAILDHVSEFLDILETLPQLQVSQAYSVPLVRGLPGRPQYSITQEQLRFLVEYNFSTKQMAEILGVSKRTVKRRLRKFNILLRDRYTNLSDSDLDNIVGELVGGNDELGAEAWNHHKLRTARYMSPHQIFIRGCLLQLHRNQTGIQGILGVDEEPVEEIDTPPATEVVVPPGAHTVFHWPEAVEIPANQLNLHDRHMEQLVQLVNPLGGRRDDLGTDLLEQVINFLENIENNRE
ncbi:hypothetical protein E1301_Tti006504 [Triplophysa tibetana]|uniref:Integrase core domain-containing protein n=1 Tax=Triplophysa tibetana TaxID=1572043 RepID=A0A5A9P1P9_9TELE|nr:hypothetical protein E1301_Tti006504 [Triplophysa tibetana]